MIQEEAGERPQGVVGVSWLVAELMVRKAEADWGMSGREMEQTESNLPPRCHMT